MVKNKDMAAVMLALEIGAGFPNLRGRVACVKILVELAIGDN